MAEFDLAGALDHREAAEAAAGEIERGGHQVFGLTPASASASSVGLSLWDQKIPAAS